MHLPPVRILRPSFQRGLVLILNSLFARVSSELHQQFYRACKAHQVTYTSGFAACVMNACQVVKQLGATDKVSTLRVYRGVCLGLTLVHSILHTR